MTESQITEKLEALGYRGSEIRTALRDVGQIIVEKTAAAYLPRLPQVQQEKLRGMTEAELAAYLAEHGASLPKMSQEEFETIHDETWEDYFRSVA